MNKFEIVYDKAKLKEIIDFLGDGFTMSLEIRISLIKLLDRNPASFPIAAITSKNGKITAAILLIAQFPYSKNNGSKVLNLSTWYALPNYRGIEPVIFIKKILNQLNDYSFTNYSPNDAASLILKSFGFINMKVLRFVFGLSRKKVFQNDLKFAKDFFAKTGLLLFSNLESLHNISSIKKSESPLYWVHSSKKYFFNLRILNIYIGNPSEFKYPNIFSIFYIMLNYKVVSLNIFLKTDDVLNHPFPMPWLLKSNDVNCSHIKPIGSELIALSKIK